MASITASTELSALIERMTDSFGIDFGDQHASAISRFFERVVELSEPELVTLNSSLVRLQFWDSAGSYQLSLTGSGLGPVNSVDRLMQAIEDGVATGAINALTLTRNNATLLTIELGANGVTVSSGNDRILLKGALPTSFPQIFELGNLVGRMEDLDHMSRAQRSQLINELTKFGVTGLTVTDNGRTVADLTITSSQITLTTEVGTLEAKGSFPSNFGRVLDVLLQIEAQTDRGLDVDPSTLTGLGLTSLEIRNAAGQSLLSLTGPLTDEQLSSVTLNGGAGDDTLNLDDLSIPGTDLLTVNLGAGNDTLVVNMTAMITDAYWRYDAPWETANFNGGAGSNNLQLDHQYGPAKVTLDLAAGQLAVTVDGRETLSLGMSNFQTVTLSGDGGYTIKGSAADETIRISRDYYGHRNGALTIDGGAGRDILDLTAVSVGVSYYWRFQPVYASALELAQITLQQDGSLRISADHWSTLPTLVLKNVEALRVLGSDGANTPVLIELASLVETTRSITAGETGYGSWLNDVLTGSDADDLIYGRDGNDRLIGGLGNDTLYGGNGTDTLNGGDGDDFLYGGDSEADLRDVIYGGNGHDYIDGGWGNDELHGGAGNDTIDGGYGADTLIGNEGNDVLSGGAGADEIHGGAGNDWINGGFGHDRLNGGAGADVFYHVGVADHGSDWIQDYNAAEGDVLSIALAGATRSQFQINFANTANAGAADVAEAFVVYRPTGQVMFALVDGAAQENIWLNLGGQRYDLLA